MNENWYEVWADQGLARPYVLLVEPKQDGGVMVFDPKEDRVIHEADDYESATHWLLEDEYRCVIGRMIRD